jgi:outer membrane biogenesis lipoprotein LolB
MLSSQFTFQRAVFSSIKLLLAVSFLLVGCDIKSTNPTATDETDTTQTIIDPVEKPDTNKTQDTTRHTGRNNRFRHRR